MNYYNENDPQMAAWLRELIHSGEIPLGDVDERSILEVKPHELTRYTQHHFFAGIGGWSYALKLAGWPEDEPVRTGSCPCQPFSQAGKRKGEKDERHLWPAFRDLIAFGKATITFGEQVTSPIGRLWLSRVRADLEGMGYVVGASDLCVACVGAPHKRQRLFWMAHANPNGRNDRLASESKRQGRLSFTDYSNSINGVANGISTRLEGRANQSARQECETIKRSGDTCWLGDSESSRCREQRNSPLARNGGHSHGANPWSNYDVCHFTGFEAGKTRRIEAGTFPLAPRLPGDVGLLRGYGNSIVPQVAAEFIQACVESL